MEYYYGRVTLSGNVNSYKKKRIVEERADSVASVQNVENKLTNGTTKSKAA